MRKEGFSGGEQNLEAGRRESGILRYIENTIIAGNAGEADAELEKEIGEYYKSLTFREKSDILYEKMMAYVTDKQAHSTKSREENVEGNEPFQANADLIAEIKVLFNDRFTKEAFSKTYAQARVDAKTYRMSDHGKSWHSVNEQIDKLQAEFQEVEQALFLKTIEGKSNISSAKSKAERLARRLLTLKTQKENLKTINLDKVPHTKENTDAAATFQFETLMDYRDQLKDGFVWLPSREKIHIDTVAALQNGRWPLLVGEAGTGKSDQADAASLELTGSLPTEVECSTTTGEKDLIVDIKPNKEDGNKLREEYQPLMRAYTGFDGPWQKEPAHSRGRIARFDESGRLGSKAYTIIKKARQKGPGDDFYGHPVLPGAAAIWTTNPVGTRYPDRRPVDPAMRREIAEIYVDYPDQSANNPETYEFMLGALLDENGHIEVAEKELAPAYIKRDFADSEKQTLEDGRVVVAEDLLIKDSSAKDHGTLWRLAGAVKTLQNSFIYGNRSPENLPPDAFRFKEDDTTGAITLDNASGELLTLSSSTITLGEIQSWMQGFKDRKQKKNEAFQVESFSEWIKLKIGIYLKQADMADRAKATAIFNHFHLLDAPPDLTDTKPITPKEIGYLSPRVPRALHVEMPVSAMVEEPAENMEDGKPPEMYTEIEVSLEDGSNVLIRKGDSTLVTRVSSALSVGSKTRFNVDGDDYSFAGTLNDGVKPVGALFSEPALHRIFSPEEVERGIIDHTFLQMEKDVEALCSMELS